jgi:hypothetical protein
MMKDKTKILLIIAVFLILLGYGYFRFHQPLFPAYGKGGIGAVGEGIYVITTGERNEIRWGVSGTLKWQGRPKNQQEIVVFDGSQVIPFGWSELKNRPLVFRFIPERIYIYDLKDLSGGYYLRKNE